MVNDKVLVTGSNRGLGASLVGEFVTTLDKAVYAAARNPETVAAGANVQPVQLDLNSRESIQTLASKCSDTSVLVNNAAIVENKPLLEVPDLEAARREMDTNYWGTLELCRAFKDILIANQGTIVNILSIGSLASIPFCGSYCATKAALLSLTQGIRGELKAHGVRVVGVIVGPMQTDMAQAGEEAGRHPPKDVARNIVRELGDATVDYIFPDPTAEHIGEVYLKSPWDLEKMFT